ncbi:hypothetical protein M2277_004949 [Paenibacillus sp. LBL]|uniref:hypothetical protein n=1 Tax=Paenibacillus sp. LBL TaxID=2940563 RepID=UPI002476AC57|nr:hypothetical protein [Paenibacillus sp. LBL]MDH6674257.1 hypothetical protein [Paenibacillus sp. LBL]
MSLLQLKIELQDLRKELGEVQGGVSAHLLKKAETLQASAFKAFSDKLSPLGFEIKESQSQTQIDSKSYTVKKLTATYGGLSFELEAPEVSAPYMGILNPITFRDKSNKTEVGIWLRKADGPNFSRSYTVPADEGEKLKQEISYAKKDLEELKEYLANIEEAKVRFYFAKNDRNAYDNFEDILNILIK